MPRGRPVKRFIEARLTTRLLCGAGIAVAAWLAAGAIFCEGSVRLHRRFLPVEPGRAAALRRVAQSWEEAAITAADGVSLRAWFLSPRGAQRGCVLLLHGAATSRASGVKVANTLLEEGYAVLMPDSRAHGESGGSIVTYGRWELDDALRWASWSRSRGCARLFGLGVSMGGVALIEAAAEQPAFRSIVAECPYRDLRTVAEERIVQKLPVPSPVGRLAAKLIVPSASLYARALYGLDLDRPAAAASAARLATPLLLIHGLEDAKIPPAHSRAIAEAAPAATLWLVPGSQHIAASVVAPAEFNRRVLEFFRATGESADAIPQRARFNHQNIWLEKRNFAVRPGTAASPG